MAIQAFNPTASPNGPVATTSVPNAQPTAGSIPGDGGKSAHGPASGVVQDSGTANLRANSQVKSATREGNTGGQGRTPPGVQSFGNGRSV